jgi:coatomer subunit beta
MALDLCLYREVVEKFPQLRSEITDKLISTFGEIKSGKVYRGALWIVGEYCETEERESLKERMQDEADDRCFQRSKRRRAKSVR